MEPNRTLLRMLARQTTSLALVLYASVSLAQPCPADIYVTDGDLSSVVFGDDEFFATISIAGTLHVDADLALLYCELYMEPGAQIVVEPGVIFDIGGCRVQACSEMWKGIFLEETATLRLTTVPLIPGYLDHVEMLDAETAVTAHDGCTVFMNEAYFENNRLCVYVPPAYPNWNDVTVFAKECTFQSNGPLVPPYPGQTTTLDQHGYAAFDVSDMALSLTGWYNIIYSCSNGIIANRSHVIIDGFVWESIQPDPAYPHYANGSGIRAFSSSGSYLLDQKGYNGILNDFQTCKYGIYTEYMNVLSRDNHMAFMGTAYRVDKSAYRTIDILHNTLDTYWNSIELRFNDGCQHLLVADNNIIFGTTFTLPGKGHSAIYSDELNSYNASSVIRDNVIHFRPGANTPRFGINLTTSDDYQVLANQVFMASNILNYSGIYTSGCRRHLIACNDVQGSFNNYGVDPGQSGIRNNMGSMPDIYCNNVDGTTNGIYFNGAAYGTDFSGNNIRTHKWGLHLNNSAIIEQQFFKGNLWYNAPVGGGIGAWYENAINANNYKFRVDPTIVIPGSNPMPPSVTPTGWFVQTTGQNFLCENAHQEHNYCDLFERERCEGCTTELDQLIATDELENEPYTEETKWILRGELFGKLEDHPDLLIADPVSADFHAAMQGTTVEEFKPVCDARATLYGLDATTAGDLELGRAELEDLLEQLAGATVQLGDETLTDAQLQDLRMAISDLHADVRAISAQSAQTIASVTASRIANAGAARIENAAVDGTEAIELNEQLVNDIYLGTLATDVSEFTPTEVSALYSIADQCPMVGGNAVYRARAVYALIDDQQTFDDHELCLPFGIEVRSVEQAVAPTVQVLPNPANDQATLFYQLNQDVLGTFILQDAVGQVVQRHALESSAGQLSFSTESLPPGLYHFVLWPSVGATSSGKLVVVR